jgi:hypothetical protein
MQHIRFIFSFHFETFTDNFSLKTVFLIQNSVFGLWHRICLINSVKPRRRKNRHKQGEHYDTNNLLTRTKPEPRF